MSLRHLLVLLLSCWLCGPVAAQLLDHAQGELIVQLAPGREAVKVFGQRTEVTDWAPIGRSLNLWTVRFDHTVHNEREVRKAFWADPAVQLVQYNHLAALRARPNDTRYAELWYFNNMGQVAGGAAGADINMEAAWDVTTGGTTPAGDEIVIAIIDNGVDLDHSDMVGNLWVNPDEVPGNGVDDDNNGYVDDVHGWNTEARNGDVEGAPVGAGHGTSVGSMAGAVGNNNRGVTGVNWRVKLMWVTDPEFHLRESEVLAAYSYVLEQRRAYDRSNGQEGAYVVAANSSFGIDGGNGNGDPADSPIWCALYDTLGEAGILSMGAVANEDLDIESAGDIPGRCVSDHLVTVTNVNAFNEKVQDAAFGAVSVDLAAYGAQVLLADRGNTYNRRTGTSFSTPAVTGAAALLYSVECATWNELVESDPAAATLYLKDILLGTVRPIPALDGITLTGGVLDVGAATEELLTRCGDCLAPTSLTVTAPVSGQNSLTVDWRQIASVDDLLLRYRIAGTTDWTEVPDATAPYLIANTADCEVYEVQLVGSCGDTDRPTAIVTVESSGCCRPPTGVSLSTPTAGRIAVTFTPQFGARRHRIRFRPLGSGEEWTANLVIGNQFSINGLDPCTEYEVQVATNCDGGVDSDYSASTVITSFGCGACTDLSYCTPVGLDNEEEWIAAVNLGNIIVSESGPSADGFRSYGDVGSYDFARGADYPISLLPGPNGLPFSGQFRVWIDLNQNGFFGQDELVYAGASAAGPEPATGTITIPETAATGLTRMRVFYESIAHRESPCGGAPRERTDVEDYCLRIVAAVTDCPPPPASVTATYNEDDGRTTLSWAASNAPGGDYLLRYRRLGTGVWNEVPVSGLSAVFNFNLCGTYEVELASQCADGPGPVRPLRFGDNCVGTEGDGWLPEGAWSVFPNPAGDHTVVEWPAGYPAAELELFTMTGRSLRLSRTGSDYRQRLDLHDLAPGIYLLRLTLTDGRTGVRRIVKR